MSREDADPPDSRGPGTGGPPVFWHFGDESTASYTGTYRVQGYVTVPETELASVTAELADLRAGCTSYGEIKWNKLKRDRPPAVVAEAVDFFASCPHLTFTSIVVPAVLDPTRGKDAYTQDRGYNQTFHLLMRYRLQPGSTNHLRLDWRRSKLADPAGDLVRCLNGSGRQLPTPFHVAGCELVCSKAWPLVQLADLFTGAVAWDHAGRGGKLAKVKAHARLCARLGWESLVRNTGRTEQKFRIWQYRPSAIRPPEDRAA